MWTLLPYTSHAKVGWLVNRLRKFDPYTIGFKGDNVKTVKLFFFNHCDMIGHRNLTTCVLLGLYVYEFLLEYN